MFYFLDILAKRNIHDLFSFVIAVQQWEIGPHKMLDTNIAMEGRRLSRIRSNKYKPNHIFSSKTTKINRLTLLPVFQLIL